MYPKLLAGADKVTLVDRNDNVVGAEDKMTAHVQGKLHRAFSIFIFNSHGELLLQKRARAKYHSGGLWSNTCCGHPRPGESTLEAASRRLSEEMGFDCLLRLSFKFLYYARLDNDLTEHEFDYVFAGQFSGCPLPDASEVDDWEWFNVEGLRDDIREKPERYTYWLKVAMEHEEWPNVLRWGIAQ